MLVFEICRLVRERNTFISRILKHNGGVFVNISGISNFFKYFFLVEDFMLNFCSTIFGPLNFLSNKKEEILLLEETEIIFVQWLMLG